jgi:hypothetical protein
VAASGLETDLREFGLEHLVGKNCTEVGVGLLDALAGPSSTIDDGAARAALDEVKNEILEDAETPADIERALTAAYTGDGLAAILMRFFSCYIFERFCRDFYERWVRAVGVAEAAKSMNDIKEYIASKLRSTLVDRDVTSVEWSREEGARVVGEVLAATCTIYEVPA